MTGVTAGFGPRAPRWAVGRLAVFPRVALLSLALLAVPTALWGHGPERSVIREMVRIQGHVVSGEQGRGNPQSSYTRLQLLVLGQAIDLEARDYRSFSVGKSDGTVPGEGATPTPQTKFRLQGERGTLLKLSNVRPEQRISILAEHRPGSEDLFVLALDLCPE